jgi:hypothetical protein
MMPENMAPWRRESDERLVEALSSLTRAIWDLSDKIDNITKPSNTDEESTEHCIDTLLREAGDNVAETQYERNVQAAKKIIRKHGPCTKRDMQRKGWRLPERETDEILRMLVETEEVISTVKEGGTGKGRPSIRYSIAL